MTMRRECPAWLMLRFICAKLAANGSLALLLFLPPAALGGGVVADCTEASLRAAMKDGGTVTFACDGTITLSATITNSLDTVLDGTGRQVTISGNNAVRLFKVAANARFEVLNLTLANGFSPGGSAILNLGGTVNLAGVNLRTNLASTAAGFEEPVPAGAGGAILNSGGTIAAKNCTFTGNAARNFYPFGRARGGAIHNESGQVSLERCDFAANDSLGGAALYMQVAGIDATGGAVDNSGTLLADLCTFALNSAAGGAGYNGYGTPGGSALGGAVCNSGVLSITRSAFANNSVTGGIGGQGYSGNVVMEQGLPGGPGQSGGAGNGGALFNNGTASLVNCTVAGNSGQGGSGGAGGQGGGGAAHWGGKGGDGGNGGNAVGGVDGTGDLSNCTLAWNTGIAGPGGPGGPGGTGVSGSGAPGAPGSSGSASGAITRSTLANSLVAWNSPAGNESFPGADAKLGDFANHGGPTPTIALLPGSPAIDAISAGTAPPTDQRGFPRPAGAAADLGAFEFGSVMPTLGVSHSDGVRLNITANGNAGQVCRLLASSDLSDWTSIATNHIGGDGTALFSLDCDAGACQFLRLVMP